MKNFKHCISALLWVSLLLVSGCKENPIIEETPTDGTSRTVILSASMPGGDDPATRVTSALMSDNKTIGLTWKEKDKIQLYFEKNNTITPGKEAEVENISSDGKTAQFQVEVPDDILGTFNLFGVHGTQSEATADGKLLVDVQPGRMEELQNITVPIFFKMEDFDPESPNQSVSFQHLGALQVVTIKNTSFSQITLKDPSLFDATGNNTKWYLDIDGDGNAPVLDFISGDTLTKALTPPSLEPVTVNIDGTDNVVLAQWILPNGTTPPAIHFKAGVNNAEKSTNPPKEARNAPLVTGNAYHIYAQWDGNALSFFNEADVQPYKITMTTTEDEIRLSINAETTERDGVWIDLNNNGNRDEDEKVIIFGNDATYTVTSQTATLYGKVNYLNCSNNQLTALDVSKNTALNMLICYNNKLTELDVSKNTALTDLRCFSNKLTALDVSKNTALNWLDCSGDSLTALDVSKNTILSGLNCSSNKLTALDVSKNTELARLNCSFNKLNELDVSKNTALNELNCNDNKLTALDVSKNAALNGLYCSFNKLNELDVSKNAALNGLYCSFNKLNELDVSKNAALDGLDCSSDSLTALDVSKNTELIYLYCYNNQLTALDVSNNMELTLLFCNNNQLTAMDVSNNTKLTQFDCYSNIINGEAMTNLVNSLPKRSEDSNGNFIVIDPNDENEENVCTKSQVEIATKKHWNVMDSSWNPYEGS